MTFHPTNPSEIPQNIEYQAQIENNPMKFWTEYAKTSDNESFTNVEKGLFKALCDFLKVSWNDLNRKSYREKYNVLAKFLYEKFSEETYNFFISDENSIGKFKQKLFNLYQKKIKKENTDKKNSSNDEQVEEIIGTIGESIQKCISDIELDVQKQIKSFEKSIFLKYLSKDSIQKIVKGNQNLLVGNTSTITSISADVLLPEIIEEIEFDVEEDREDNEIIEDKLESIQKILNTTGTNEIQNRLKEVLREKSNNSIRLLSLNRLNTYYKNLNSLTERTRKTRIGKTFGKIQNFMYVYGGERGREYFTKKVSEATFSDVMFKIPAFKRAISGSEANRKEFDKALEKSGKGFNKLSNAKAYKAITFPLQIIGTYVLTINFLASKTLKVAVQTLGLGLKKLGNLIDKVGNSLFDFLSNPINAFAVGFVGSFLVQFFFRLKSNWLKNKLSFYSEVLFRFTSKLMTDAFWYFVNWIDKFFTKLRKDYPLIDNVANFTEFLIDKIKNSFVFRTAKKTLGWFYNELSSETRKIYDRNKDSYEIKKEEFKKQGKSYSFSTYLTDSNGFAETTFNVIKDDWNNSTVGKFLNGFIKIGTGFFSLFSKVSFEIIRNFGPAIDFVSSIPGLPIFLNSLKDLFTTKLGAIATAIGFSGIGGWLSLLAIPAFLVVDMFYRAVDSKKGNVINIKTKYKNLYRLDLTKDKMEILNSYTSNRLDSFLIEKGYTGEELERRKQFLTERFSDFYDKVVLEASILDDNINKIVKYQNLFMKSDSNDTFMILPEGLLKNFFTSDLYGITFSTWKTQFENLYKELGTKPKIFNAFASFLLSNLMNLRSNILDYFILDPITSTNHFRWEELENLFLNQSKGNLFLENIGKLIDTGPISAFGSTNLEIWMEAMGKTMNMVKDLFVSNNVDASRFGKVMKPIVTEIQLNKIDNKLLSKTLNGISISSEAVKDVSRGVEWALDFGLNKVVGDENKNWIQRHSNGNLLIGGIPAFVIRSVFGNSNIRKVGSGAFDKWLGVGSTYEGAYINESGSDIQLGSRKPEEISKIRDLAIQKEISRLDNLITMLISNEAFASRMSPFLGEIDVNRLNEAKIKILEKMKDPNFFNSELFTIRYASIEDFMIKEILKELVGEEEFQLTETYRDTGITSYDTYLDMLYEDLISYYNFDKDDKKIAELVSFSEDFCNVFGLDKKKYRVERLKDIYKELKEIENKKKAERKENALRESFNKRMNRERNFGNPNQKQNVRKHR